MLGSCPEDQSENDDRNAYFALSRRPMVKEAEDDMELIGHVIGEVYLDHYERGAYACARCGNVLYWLH